MGAPAIELCSLKPASRERESDAEPIDRPARGAMDLEQVARAELPRVERLLLRMLGPRPDLEDLVQNVFLELCRAQHRFRGESKLSTYVGGITVRVARRAMRRPAFVRKRGEMPTAPVHEGITPEEGMEDRERMRRLRRALEKISAKKRIAFCLWALEGLAVDEVARLTGASVAATESRIHYAQKELRKRASRDPWLAELFLTAADPAAEPGTTFNAT